MNKKAASSVSIVNRLTLLVLLLGAIALAALFISARIANETKGSAYMINQLGLLRMKSYQLLSLVPLKPDDYHYISLFTDIPLETEYQELLSRYELMDDFNQLQSEWRNQLATKIQNATSITEVRSEIVSFVAQVDRLVHAIDQKTEQQIETIRQVQIGFIIFIVLFLIALLYYLRQHLLSPLKHLMYLAESITKHDFKSRFQITHKRQDEFDSLGQAFNRMSDEIESQYSLLEQRVNEKTNELQTKNDIVTFLYRSIQQLHTQQPICERFLVILQNLEQLTPLSRFQIRFYESNDPEEYHLIRYDQDKKESYCQNQHCSACLIHSKPLPERVIKRSWYLQDNDEKYGLVTALQPEEMSLSEEQEQLITTVIEQMTMTLMLERQTEYQTQLLLMKERSAIARELHDSIAQSLSCLKINISCLQMQKSVTDEESERLLQTMRKEINVAYSQLRELITTFRLKVNRTGFLASLQDIIHEFNQKLGFQINLDYQLPLQIIDSQHAIHLLQIIREALNNIYKHAKATTVNIKFTVQDNHIMALTIQDNGTGLPQNWKKDDHYGLIIMKDRTELLQGFFNIDSAPNKGTTITITFKEHPEPTLIPVNLI
ncbi:nitrate/nitrite two-component system sensor histidine kinase NarX [Zophobihabitans entericus]|uniref:Sensor protein n=1 Tax=Zophobihabitans entericus TaxID=1635327 RepID=A0A6G9I844_9GAMM|nr:nitrate/nitrite two-component system sensor histidine kinase NarX [Zophobihabitans entericus]QIQ20381.1 nitrate/nitrite two-component system sensor histidine kinase NarX [Zophobihabitans entericus]